MNNFVRHKARPPKTPALAVVGPVEPDLVGEVAAEVAPDHFRSWVLAVEESSWGEVVGVAAGLSSDFSDLAVWGFVALVLAVMSYFGHREKQRRRAEQQQQRVR